MSKRALILWVCFGTLLLSAAKITPIFRAPEPPPSAHVNEVDETEAVSQGGQFDLLNAVYGPSQTSVDTPLIAPGVVNESTIWLARAIYSETKLPHEQELVAWVIWNRVETGYRDQTTYKEVVLDPYQFSAFNPDAKKRSFFLNLTPEVQLPSWQQALWIAHYVRHADPAYRPFSVETRHFYSERSMRGNRHPYWVNRQQFVTPGWEYRVNERRFRFYEEIS